MFQDVRDFIRRSYIDSADIEDLVNGTFFVAYEEMERKAGPLDEAKAFLFKVASNKMRTYRRSRSRDRARLDRLQQQAQVDARSDSPDATCQVDDRDELACQPALSVLTDRQREAFLLRHYYDLKLAEIAVVMGIEVTSVRTHLTRASRTLAGLVGMEAP